MLSKLNIVRELWFVDATEVGNEDINQGVKKIDFLADMSDKLGPPPPQPF